MKNRKLFNSIVKETSPLGGLSRTDYANSSKASGTSLTLDKLQKMYDYLTSEEYEKKVREEQLRESVGHTIVSCALHQGIINEEEAFRLGASISINGALYVSSEVYKRLEKVKLPQWINTLCQK